ncbi:MAG TPA: FkbM family methyltransferase [Candidatus Babeliales bacterium]|nr:FkbM family methyltransferase [Candidatus Babeliales bacterium]
MIIFNPHKTIDILKQFLPDNPVIVEAGAFDGNDTRKMSLQWSNGIIHAFEPLDEIYQRLYTNTASLSNIYYHSLALSAHTGTALFYVSERPTRPGIASQAGSLHKPKERLSQSPLIFPRTAIVSTVTLDEWAEHNKVNNIDLLWLDTQGHELAILKAAPHMIKNIKVILTEVAFIESYEGQSLYIDIVAWMNEHNFELVGCDFEKTTASFFGNALFIHRAFITQ